MCLGDGPYSQEGIVPLHPVQPVMQGKARLFSPAHSQKFQWKPIKDLSKQSKPLEGKKGTLQEDGLALSMNRNKKTIPG